MPARRSVAGRIPPSGGRAVQVGSCWLTRTPVTSSSPTCLTSWALVGGCRSARGQVGGVLVRHQRYPDQLRGPVQARGHVLAVRAARDDVADPVVRVAG